MAITHFNLFALTDGYTSLVAVIMSINCLKVDRNIIFHS